MIRLYTAKEKCSKVRWVQNIDPYFNSHITVKSLTRGDLNVMKKLEGVELVDRGSGLFKTKSGIIPLYYISTGLKTLLIIRHLKRERVQGVGVDITECGPNILDSLFEEITDGSVPVVLRHTDIFELKDRVVSVNESAPVRTMSTLFDKLIKG